MKKTFLGGMVVAIIVMIVLGFQNIKKEYEFYDLNGNYGMSLNCDDKDKLTCLTKDGWIEVSQYSEVTQ